MIVLFHHDHFVDYCCAWNHPHRLVLENYVRRTDVGDAGERRIREGLVGGEAFSIDASLISADANRLKGIERENGLPSKATGRVAGHDRRTTPGN